MERNPALPKRILITTYGGAHVALTLPLRAELEARGHEVIILALTTAGPVCDREGIPHRRPIEFVNLEDPNVQQFGRMLAKNHHNEGSGLTLNESIAYLGESYRELVEDVGESDAESQYAEQGLNALHPVRFMERIISEISPDVVVSTDSPRMERAAMTAARNLGKSSVCVICIFPHIGMQFLKEPTHGELLCVCSENVRQQMIAVGRNPSSVVVTGNPAWDTLAREESDGSRIQLRNRRGLGDDDFVFLWAEQPEPGNDDLPRRIRYRLAEICEQHKNWHLLVRLHPSSTDPASEIMPRNAMVSDRTEPLEDALDASDVVITMTSTVGYEALLLDKPVLILEMSKYSHTVDYSFEDGAMVIDSMEEIHESMQKLLTPDSFSRHLSEKRQALPRPGGAARRVADQILSMEQHRKSA